MSQPIAQNPFIQAQAGRIRDVIAAFDRPLREVVTTIHAVTGYSFSAPQLSRLQNGLQAATFEEIDVLARADPLQRGRNWLGWGEAAAPTRSLRAPARDKTSAPPGAPDSVGSWKDELREVPPPADKRRRAR